MTPIDNLKEKTMLYQTLINISSLLNDYLKLRFKLTHDIVFLASTKESDSTIPANRVGVSIINIERETVAGISFKRQQIDNQKFGMSAPDWQINVYLLFSVVFEHKQYGDSLQILSGVLSFIQKNKQLNLQNYGTTYSIEPVNLSFSELSNIWSINGGTYHPSIVCKLRLLTIDEQEITSVSTGIKNNDIDIH